MLEKINMYIVGPVLPCVIFIAGIILLFKLRGFPFTRIRLVSKLIFKNSNNAGVSPFSALCLSLAGTLGVGNIVGVAAAIAIGGAGAVFWMLLSALAVMTVKYAEVVLGFLTRRFIGGEYHGGPMFYIKNRHIAAIFALLIVLCSIPLGSLIQVRAASDALSECFNINPIITGATFALLCAIIVGGGLNFITKFTEKLIPLLSVCYIALTLSIIILRIEYIPNVLLKIISDAFKFDSAYGGILGFLLSSALRAGVSRGILSNEAGLGTAPIAHSHSNASNSVCQGVMGIFEVFADTVLLCSLTALAILSAPITEIYDGGMLYVLNAFGSVIKIAPFLLAVSIALFAIATVIAWAHYGIEALSYLNGSKTARIIYVIIYSSFTFFGAILSAELSWNIAELLTGVITIINISAVLLHSDKISSETIGYLSTERNIRQSRSPKPSDKYSAVSFSDANNSEARRHLSS